MRIAAQREPIRDFRCQLEVTGRASKAGAGRDTRALLVAVQQSSWSSLSENRLLISEKQQFWLGKQKAG